MSTRELVFCFGLLHDTRRENEYRDPEHGARAARVARELEAEGVLRLAESRSLRLDGALRSHSDGLVSTDPTTGACWDADRLHLPRVGIEPDSQLFSTAAAHRPARLPAAAGVRERPPTWDELLALV